MMQRPQATDPTVNPPDLAGCSREPIHIPGSIQPHGVLIVLAEHDFAVRQISENARTLLDLEPGLQAPRKLIDLLGADHCSTIVRRLEGIPLGARAASLGPLELSVRGEPLHFHAVGHRTDDGIILELERVPAPDADTELPEIVPVVDDFTLEAEASKSVEHLSNLICRDIRKLTGCDRVLVYQFDESWNGIVVGEDGNRRLPSYLHHRFPASDIPAQARELYRVNRVRIIPDADYVPVRIVPEINPATRRTLDMSFSTLRSVSPIHVEYMRNMETMSSMSVSILRDGKLWGLISCHHRTARNVTFPVRSACEFMARAFSLRLSALERDEDYQRNIEVRSAYTDLVAIMADRGDFAAALAEKPKQLLAFGRAGGAAILTESGCRLFGATPTEEQVRELADWIFHEVGREVYATDAISTFFPRANTYKDKASGVLSVSISKLRPSAVLWFRPEVIQTIKWGGDPTKPVTTNGDRQTLHPRRSFETWRETVRDRSLPWRVSELDAAAELRNTIVGTVLRKAEELAELNSELTRSNKELEAFSYSVSHDLRAPLRHIVGYAEMLKETGETHHSAEERRFINTIIESSEYAGRLVDKLLSFSRLGRAKLERTAFDMTLLVNELVRDVMIDAGGRDIEWKIDRLPVVFADLMMMRMAVRDLLSNAVKYTRMRDHAVIEIGCQEASHEYIFSVKDNGVGFDMAYADKLFGVFQRLHKWEEFEGTGIGLANVRRVLERHSGRTWAEGKENAGATFFFTLPKVEH